MNNDIITFAEFCMENERPEYLFLTIVQEGVGDILGKIKDVVVKFIKWINDIVKKMLGKLRDIVFPKKGTDKLPDTMEFNTTYTLQSIENFFDTFRNGISGLVENIYADTEDAIYKTDREEWGEVKEHMVAEYNRLIETMEEVLVKANGPHKATRKEIETARTFSNESVIKANINALIDSKSNAEKHMKRIENVDDQGHLSVGYFMLQQMFSCSSRAISILNVLLNDISSICAKIKKTVGMK